MAYDPTGRRILVIEDQGDLRDYIRATLEPEGYEIHEAATAELGRQQLRSVAPELVLLDIMLPGSIDGLQLCRELKSDPALHSLKVVLVTARGHRNDFAIAREYGADDYLLKPFSTLRLSAVVRQLLAVEPA